MIAEEQLKGNLTKLMILRETTVNLSTTKSMEVKMVKQLLAMEIVMMRTAASTSLHLFKRPSLQKRRKRRLKSLL
jgi:hypothetical protein